MLFLIFNSKYLIKFLVSKIFEALKSLPELIQQMKDAGAAFKTMTPTTVHNESIFMDTSSILENNEDIVLSEQSKFVIPTDDVEKWQYFE